MVESRPNTFCCGVMEIGNFAYVKDRGPNGLPHYHRKASNWQVQSKAEETTEDEVRTIVAPLTRRTGALICTTGADQEYMDEILLGMGFVRQDFKNVVHEKGEVKFWFLASSNYKEAKDTKAKKDKG